MWMGVIRITNFKQKTKDWGLVQIVTLEDIDGRFGYVT